MTEPRDDMALHDDTALHDVIALHDVTVRYGENVVLTGSRSSCPPARRPR